MEVVPRGHLKFDDVLDTRAVSRLRLDLRQMTYLNIYGLVGMACCVLSAANSGSAIEIALPMDTSAANFLTRLGFDRFVRTVGGVHCEPASVTYGVDEDVVVAVSTFDSAGDLIPLQDLLHERLEGMAGPQSREAIGEALWELGTNVTAHSGSRGIVAATVQGRKRKERHIDFALGDAGIGIRESFLRGQARHHPPTDHKAIELATEYLVSSIDDPGRGQGLSTTIDVATSLAGRVIVRSGNAKRTMFRKQGSYGLGVIHAAESVPRLAGTLVGVRVPCA